MSGENSCGRSVQTVVPDQNRARLVKTAITSCVRRSLSRWSVIGALPPPWSLRVQPRTLPRSGDRLSRRWRRPQMNVRAVHRQLDLSKSEIVFFRQSTRSENCMRLRHVHRVWYYGRNFLCHFMNVCAQCLSFKMPRFSDVLPFYFS